MQLIKTRATGKIRKLLPLSGEWRQYYEGHSCNKHESLPVTHTIKSSDVTNFIPFWFFMVFLNKHLPKLRVFWEISRRKYGVGLSSVIKVMSPAIVSGASGLK